jgi:TatD DNase family protein
MGFYIGVGGVATFKNGRKLKEVIADVPMESIILETDSPYLAPVPFRGKRNDSSNIKYVVEAIREIKGIETEEIERITFENAKKMYRLA